MDTFSNHFQPKNQQDSSAWMDPQRKNSQMMSSELTFDPSLHENYRKTKSLLHLPCLLGTIVFYASIIIVANKINTFEERIQAVWIIVLAYTFYLFCSIPCGDLVYFIHNLRTYPQYQKYHEELHKAKGHFIFNAKCYHFTDQNKNPLSKVITHEVSQRCDCVSSLNESGRIVNPFQAKYAFIEFKKEFVFDGRASKIKLLSAFNYFKEENKVDQEQQYSCIFEIDDFQPMVGFFTDKGNGCQKVLFLLTAFFGLAIFYGCIMERFVNRYEIKLKKKMRF